MVILPANCRAQAAKSNKGEAIRERNGACSRKRSHAARLTTFSWYSVKDNPALTRPRRARASHIVRYNMVQLGEASGIGTSA